MRMASNQPSKINRESQLSSVRKVQSAPDRNRLARAFDAISPSKIDSLLSTLEEGNSKSDPELNHLLQEIKKSLLSWLPADDPSTAGKQTSLTCQNL